MDPEKQILRKRHGCREVRSRKSETREEGELFQGPVIKLITAGDNSGPQAGAGVEDDGVVLSYLPSSNVQALLHGYEFPQACDWAGLGRAEQSP